MELKDILQQMMQESMKSAQLADLQIGTVTAVNPLEITISASMAPLRASVLYLTSGVVEKKIPLLEHVHTITVHDSYTGGGISNFEYSLNGNAMTCSLTVNTVYGDIPTTVEVNLT